MYLRCTPNKAKKHTATTITCRKVKETCTIQQRQCKTQVFLDPIPSRESESGGVLTKGDTRLEGKKSLSLSKTTPSVVLNIVAHSPALEQICNPTVKGVSTETTAQVRMVLYFFFFLNALYFFQVMLYL